MKNCLGENAGAIFLSVDYRSLFGRLPVAKQRLVKLKLTACSPTKIS